MSSPAETTVAGAPFPEVAAPDIHDNRPPRAPRKRKAPRIPLEFVLLSRLVHRYGINGLDWTPPVKRTEITRRFLYYRKRDGLSPLEFRERVLRSWFRRRLATAVPNTGRPPALQFRLPSPEESRSRLDEIGRVHRELQARYDDPASPEYRNGATHSALRRLCLEAESIRIQLRAEMDRRLDSAPAVGR